MEHFLPCNPKKLWSNMGRIMENKWKIFKIYVMGMIGITLSLIVSLIWKI